MLNFLLRLMAPLVTFATPLLIWAAKRSPYIHITNKDGTPYMNRYWVVFPRWITGGWGIRLHHIVSSDDDRALHDHPWDFGSIILRGGYFEVLGVFNSEAEAQWSSQNMLPGTDVVYEQTTGKTVVGKWMRPGDVNLKLLSDYPWHRIRLTEEMIGLHAGTLDQTWTFFVSGPRKNGWGFLTPSGKVGWRDYLKETYSAEHVKETEAKLAAVYGGKPR